MNLPEGLDIDHLIDDLRRLGWEAADIMLYYSNQIRNEKASKHANEVRQGNPLLNQDEGAAVQSGVAASNVIKSRWDDDVVFKHQARGAMKNKKKSFVNDTTRNDFHRKFMDKYIK